MQGLIFITPLAAFLCAALLPGQKTWIVDTAGGPGSHFNELPRAVAAARHGDRIRIRKGRYASGLSISKGVSILGEAGVVLVLERPFVGYPDPLRLERIPKGYRLVLENLTIENPAPNWHSFPLLLVRNNQGAIHLENVVIKGYLGGKGHVQERALDVESGPLVTLNRCTFAGQVWVKQGRLDVVGGTYRGANAARGDSLVLGRAGQAAFLVEGAARLDLTQVQAFGGNGGTEISLRPLRSAPGIRVARGQVLVRGAQTRITAGGLAVASAPAIEGAVHASLAIDPGVRLAPYKKNRAIAGFTGVAVQIRSLPSLQAQTAARLGKVFFAEFRSQQGMPYVVFVGRAQASTRALGPLSAMPQLLELDPRLLFPLSHGLQSRSGLSIVALPIPRWAPVSGVPLAIQGFALDARGIQASNLLVTVAD